MAHHSPFAQGNGHSANGQPAGAAVNGQASAPTPADGADRLRALAGMLWGGKWILLGVFVLVVGIAAAYTYSIPPTYSTSTLLLVNQDNGNSVPSLSGRGSMSSMYGQGRNLANEILILNRSGTIPRRVAQRLDSMETYPRSDQRLDILYNADGSRRPVSHVAGIVRGSARAQQAGRDVDAIRISTQSTEPRDAALIANLYAQEYIARTREKSRESLRAKERFLEQQAGQFQESVETAETDIEQYMRREGAVSLDQESSGIVDRLSSLEVQRDELRIELDMEKAALETQKEELAKIRPKLSEQISSGLDEELSRVQQQRAELESRINQIKQENPTLTPGDGSRLAQDLARLQARSNRLAEEADSLAETYVSETLAAGGVGSGSGEGQRGLTYVVEKQKEIAQQQIKVSGLEARLQAIQSRIAEYQERMQDLPSQSLELAQLQRERRSAEQIYGFVREKLQETRMAMESEVGYAEVVSPAGIPGVPISPNTQRNLMLAAILGLLLGGGLVYLRERLDTRLRTPGDLRSLGHRVIGVVPSMQSLIDDQFGGQKEVEIDGQQIQTSLVMLTSPMSAAAESYRRLRANLRFARPDADIRSFVVSSSEQGEGKTTTAANLALAMASAGKETLLVDADLRRPRLHTFFSVARTPGLTEALYEDTLDIDALATTVENLSVLPAGEEVPNPAELLGSKRMGALLERLEQEFDAVIVDTPPLLLFSDPISLTPHTDGALLVAAANQTDGRAFSHAVDLLQDIDTTPIGAVLNQYDTGVRPGYGGYSTRNYSYENYAYRYGDRQLEAYYEGETENGSVASALKFWKR